MSLVARLAPHLPYVRRYARALTGDQHTGDQYVRVALEALAAGEQTLDGGLSPRVLPMAEIRDLGGLLQRAGFSLPVADSFTKTVIYPDALALMQDLRAMGEANALAARLRVPTLHRTADGGWALWHHAGSNRRG